MDQSSRRTPSTRMAETIARTQVSSTPSEKLGTHATIGPSIFDSLASQSNPERSLSNLERCLLLMQRYLSNNRQYLSDASHCFSRSAQCLTKPRGCNYFHHE